MSDTVAKITAIEHETHNVLNIRTEKPSDIDFIPGQATELSINQSGWKDESRPFTFVCLPQEDYLEFMIKTYPSHEGVTNQLLQLRSGDELLMGEVFGAIQYAGEGTFIAGGAGVTPFISILRSLRDNNKIGANRLIFANKDEKDIILKNEFLKMLGLNFINILEEEKTGFASGRITEGFLMDSGMDFDKHIYLCGPPKMMEAVRTQLFNLGASEDNIIQETF